MKRFAIILIIFGITLLWCVSAIAQVDTIDYSGKVFTETVDYNYWLKNPHEGVEVDSIFLKFTSKFHPFIIFHYPLCLTEAKFHSSIEFWSAKFSSTAGFKSTKFDSSANFRYAKFDSSANFSKVEFASTSNFKEVIFSSTANFKEAKFTSRTDFSNAEFHNTANFNRVIYDSTASFCNTKFTSTANFDKVIFASIADFCHAKFDSAAEFKKAKFASIAYFWGAEFHSPVNFVSSKFHSIANFNFNNFKSSTAFKYAKFMSIADFTNAKFDFTADFENAKFDSTAEFKNAKFASVADFKNTMFREGANFYKAVLPDSIDFRYVNNIGNEIDFTYCLLPDEKNKCFIALAGSDISKIKLRMDLFKLWFPADSIYKEGIWKIDSLTYDQKVSVYEQVLNKIKSDGLIESYEILDIDYRQFKYENKPRKYPWDYVYNPLFNFLHKYWWNYGYNKERVFLWAIGLWLLFTLINLKYFKIFNESIYPIKFLKKTQYGIILSCLRLIFYVMYVATYTAIIFFGLKIKFANFSEGVIRKHPGLFIYFMLIYVSGLVCLGFIANIIFTKG